MSRAQHITPSCTAGRIDRLRLLIITLSTRQLMRDEIGELLQVGPSGVRKYVKDLGDKLAIVRHVDPTPKCIGQPVYRLAMTSEAAAEYLASLAASAAARPRASLSALTSAQSDPSRHFHILADDTHYAIRPSRTPAGRDPLVAALFGVRSLEVRA